MTALAETSTWEDEIYQLEETDVVQGGAPGIDNLQPRQLANRTRFLKNLVEALGTGKLDLSALASQAQAEAGADNTKWMTPLRVAQAIAALASIAMASETTAGKVELATVAETITGTDTARATHSAGVKAAIAAAVAAVVNSSPTTLDTLNELASALGNDPNFATSITTLIAGKLATSAKSSTVQAQAGTDDATYMTPLKVAQALTALSPLFLSSFTGANQTLASPGQQKLPGGLILKFGKIARTVSGDVTVTFAEAFPTELLAAVSVPFFGSSISNTWKISSVSAANMVLNSANAAAGYYEFWIAVGH